MKKALFMIAPVYFNTSNNEIEPRGVLGYILLNPCLFIFSILSYVTTLFIDYDPVFPIRMVE